MVVTVFVAGLCRDRSLQLPGWFVVIQLELLVLSVDAHSIDCSAAAYSTG